MDMDVLDAKLAAIFGRPVFYILRDGVPRPASVTEIVQRGGASERLFLEDVGRFTVSTVFLGMDAMIHGDGPPLLFETMIFPDGPLWRYATLSEAVAGHDAAAAWARAEHAKERPLKKEPSP
jgi:hypothetical protein